MDYDRSYGWIDDGHCCISAANYEVFFLDFEFAEMHVFCLFWIACKYMLLL